MAGKGDRYRPVDRNRWNEGYDRAFGKDRTVVQTVCGFCLGLGIVDLGWQHPDGRWAMDFCPYCKSKEQK